jgi:DNA-binding NarL/FixJ family response regulator
MGRERVLVADDHGVVVAGVRAVLEPEFEIVGVVEDGRALVVAAAELHPDIIVTDISMPLLNGIEAIRQVKKADPAARAIVLTVHEDIAQIVEAFRAGASGYLLKTSATTELPTAVRAVLKGGAYVTPLIAGDVLDNLLMAPVGRKAAGEPTERQREVIQLVSEGHSVKEIAAVLGISERTVEFHKHKISEELGLRNTAEITRYAVKDGIVSD